MSGNEVGFNPLALRDRAFAFLTEHQEPVADDMLIAFVYGGPPPAALRGQLARPLLGDPRFERRGDGTWSVIGRAAAPSEAGPPKLELTALALAATGPTPGRGRLVGISALHLHSGDVTERFSATVNPGKRVPRYVAERLGLAPEVLDDQPPFETVLDDLLRFLGQRPVFVQDARLTWAFVDAEARRIGRVLAVPRLIDANRLATRLLSLKNKPTLALVAAQLGISTLRVQRPEEEARVLAMVASRLLALAEEQGYRGIEELTSIDVADGPSALRRGATARALPEEPGVYVLRDNDQVPLYVGKARRLRSRLAAYIHRPLGATRRLEGLVEAVQAVDPTLCATDLEALVLEDREIRRLQPRFNTVRQQRMPRLWIRLPPPPAPRLGKNQLAPRRLEPSPGPSAADGEFVGPFRNETAAEQARALARAVFDLDALRRGEATTYEDRLREAWAFLHGQTEAAQRLARQCSTRLLRAVLAFDVQALLLPSDPRAARYVVVRPHADGLEAFLVVDGVFRAWRVLAQDDDVTDFAAELLADGEPRTGPDDVAVVLRWLGAQRSPARLVCLPDDPQAAADAIEDAAASAAASWAGEAGATDL